LYRCLWKLNIVTCILKFSIDFCFKDLHISNCPSLLMQAWLYVPIPLPEILTSVNARVSYVNWVSICVLPKNIILYTLSIH
jgi:hypothetical protein